MGSKGSGDSIDCSGAVCKVLKASGVDRGNPNLNNSAQHLDSASVAVKPGEEKDGDLITFKTETNHIDHIGFLVIDKTTGKKYIAESSASFNGGRIVPFDSRIAYLDSFARSKGRKLEYHIKRLKT